MINGHNGYDRRGKGKNGHPALRIVTHIALHGAERDRRIAKGLNEGARGTGKKPSWFQKRLWTTSNVDKAARWGKFTVPVPVWLNPPAVTWSVTASVVWGLCGMRCIDHEEA